MEKSETGGVYDVNESGVQFRHMPPVPTPRDGREFLSRLESGFRLKVLERPSPDELVFEMVGVDVSFANALRRILIADVPTVAIEHVYMWNNSSIVHDEVLAHRIGLVPIAVDPRRFDDFADAPHDEPTDRNTVVFRLSVTCGHSSAHDQRIDRARMARDSSQRAAGAEEEAESVLQRLDLDAAASEASALFQATAAHAVADAIETPGRPYTRHVYSKDLEWVPQGEQARRFPQLIRPVHDDILLAKLRPGQMIELEAHGRRGTGADHAKFSPVATAAYRLMPHVQLLRPVYDSSAEQLANLYEPGVFKLVRCGPDEAPHLIKAVVDNPYACSMSRNYMKDPLLKDSVKITRIPNHFIFTIESVGMLPPAVLLAESLRILQVKCLNIIRLADDSLENEGLND